MRLFGRGEGHLWFGRLLATWPVRAEGAPLLDGCTTVLTEVDDESGLTRTTSYGGVSIRPLSAAVGWRGARTPNPGRWLSPRFVAAHVRWILRGRPPRRVRDLFPVVGASSSPIEYERRDDSWRIRD